MNSVRDKIFLIYLIFTLGILGLAGFSYYSSQKLTEKIESLTEPNKKSIYIKEINTSLTKFTNLYFESPNSILYSKEHDEILSNIQETIILLRELYSEDEIESIEALDSIPEILDSIKNAHKEIRYLNKQYQDDFYERVEEEILKKITINDLKDAGYVEEKVKNEIIKIIEKDTALKEAQKPKEENQGILGNLFVSEKEEPIKPSLSEKVSKVKKETLLSSDIDNLFFSKKVDYIKNEVNKVLYQEQIKAIKIRSKERQIFNSNVALINKLESIFQKIQREDDEKLRETTISTYNASKRFNKILIFIISAFGFISLALLFFLFKDIERNRYYQKLLRASEKKALRKAREKQRFLSTMSHELRTPLTSILGFTELLDPKSDYKQAIYSSSKYLLNIVNEVFDLAKIEEGKIEIKTETVSLTSLLNELKLNFKELIENEGLDARFDFPRENILVEMDPYRIKQVLFNLVHNAIKFTPQGYVSISVETKLVEKDILNTKIAVADSGIGIKEEEHEKIFKEFVQSGTDKDKIKGIGLGLGIVKKIIQAMGGSIHLKSHLNQGSEFTIELNLPLRKIEEVTIPDKVGVIENFLTNVNILTLDDDEFISKLYGDILKPFGAQVHRLNDPYQALDILSKENDFNLFITDIKMPGMTGLDLIRSLHQKNVNLPKVLGVTANIFFEEENKNYRKYIDAILLKPFTRDELLLQIKELVFPEKNINKDSGHSIKSLNLTQPEDQPKESKEANYSLPSSTNDSPIFPNDSHSKINYDLKQFHKMAMNDPDLIQENSELFFNQNLLDFVQFEKLLSNQDFNELAELIHKLSGRFSQIKAEVRQNPKKIEITLRGLDKTSTPNSNLISEMLELLEDWKTINDEIKFLSNQTSPNREVLHT